MKFCVNKPIKELVQCSGLASERDTDSVSRNFLNSWAVLPHSTCDHCIISFTVIVDLVHSQDEPLLVPSFKKADFDGIFLNFPSQIDLILFNCNYILFTKLPWPGDSEGTFWSSSQAATCLPHTAEASHSPFNC